MSMQLSWFAALVGTLVVSVVSSSGAHRGESPHLERPLCVPCDPNSALTGVCDCRDITTIRVPNNPGLVHCMRTIEKLCSDVSQGTVNDFVLALAVVSVGSPILLQG